jgi:hypothetical protein
MPPRNSNADSPLSGIVPPPPRSAIRWSPSPALVSSRISYAIHRTPPPIAGSQLARLVGRYPGKGTDVASISQKVVPCGPRGEQQDHAGAQDARRGTPRDGRGARGGARRREDLQWQPRRARQARRSRDGHVPQQMIGDQKRGGAGDKCALTGSGTTVRIGYRGRSRDARPCHPY